MNTKNCLNPNCKQNNPQPIENFHKNKSKKDGLQNWCKSCISIYIKSYVKTPKGKSVRLKAKSKYVKSEYGKEQIKKYNQEYYQANRDKFLKPQKEILLRDDIRNVKLREYFKTEKGKAARKRYIDNPENKNHIKATSAVNNAIRKQEIPPISTQLCSICNSQAEHYHHYDGYSKENWLKVIPVCTKCHGHIHASL